MFHSQQSDSDPRLRMSRSDHLAFITAEKDEREVLSELRLRNVMDRTRVQGRGDARSNTFDKRQHHSGSNGRDARDTIWNSFTGSYHGRNHYENSDQEYGSGLYSDDQYMDDILLHDDSNRSEDIHNNWHMLYGGASRTTPRRVKFAEKLEIRSKVRPETPKTPTISILRKDLKHDGSQRWENQRREEDRADHHQPRDPTPKAENDAVKEPPRDPPTEGAKFETPDRTQVITSLSEVERRTRSADRLQGNPFHTPDDYLVRSIKSAEPHGQRRTLEPSPTPPTRSVAPKTDILHAMELLQKNGRNFDNIHDRRNTNGPSRSIDPTNARPSRMYPPLQELVDSLELDTSSRVPGCMAPTPREGPTDVPLAWRMDCASPTDGSTDSQTAFLINKYSRGSKVMRAARSLVRAAGSVASPGTAMVMNSMMSPTRAGSSVRTATVATGGSGSKNAHKLRGYSHLDEDSVAQEGTELILVSPTPEQFLDESNEVPVDELSMKGLESPHPASNRRNLLDSLDNESYDLGRDGKPSTSETDDSDSDIFYNWKGSEWDTFDARSEGSGQSYDYLIPSTRNYRKSRRRRVFSLSVMLISAVCLFVAVYFKFYGGSFTKTEITLEESSCVTQEIISSERFLQIREHLVNTSVGDTAMLETTGSSQRKSLCWLADFDERQLATEEVDPGTLLQRYTLGVLFFSLTNEDITDPISLQSTDFLSAKHECEWEVVMCSKEDTVTALLLADKKIEGELPAEIANLKDLCKYLTCVALCKHHSRYFTQSILIILRSLS